MEAEDARQDAELQNIVKKVIDSAETASRQLPSSLTPGLKRSTRALRRVYLKYWD